MRTTEIQYTKNETLMLSIMGNNEKNSEYLPFHPGKHNKRQHRPTRLVGL